MTTFNNVTFSKTATLGAAAEDIVNFRQAQTPTVTNFSTTDTISVRVDGVAAVSDADDTIAVPAGSSLSIPVLTAQVRLISAGTPKYQVMAL